MIRYSIAIAVVVFAITQLGCISTRGSGAPLPTTHPTDLICLSRSEVAKIQAYKIRCRSTVAQLRADASHQSAVLQKKHTAEIQQCKVRLAGCLKQATIAQTCPSCLQPVIIAGVVAGSVGLVVGVVVGVVGVLAARGEIRP